ncbi:hypothetical protein M1439_02085 [Candidatus Marsarchaeota archaeon]|jgi:hypothetical protein|nr:hypothetical protein [Candidatus Marsarchaeota archaeon]MCL5122871.1 hypothetical protein [Candidatus Marsarchaeota archaeon]
MVYKKEDRTGHVRQELAESVENLEAAQKRSSSLDLEIKKGLRRIFPELAIDYDEIAHSAYLGSSFSASIDYKEQVRQLGTEAKEIIDSKITGSTASDIRDKIDAAAESIEKGVAAKEALAKQLRGTDRKSEHIFLIYSDSKLDSITLSDIESKDSELRKMLSKYKINKLIIAASCEGMMANGEYSDVLLRYKTFASSYRRVAIEDAQMRRMARMLKDGSIYGMIQEYVQGIDGMFNANIAPRLIARKNVLDLASEVYCYEDYGAMVRKAQSDLIKEILAKL